MSPGAAHRGALEDRGKFFGKATYEPKTPKAIAVPEK